MPVNSTHKEYDKYSAKWKRCRDNAQGQDAIHAAGAEYLPKLGGQTDNEYKAYKMRASYYAATARTIDGLTGMLFRKDPEIKTPTSLDRYKSDITRDGVTLINFAEQVGEELLQVSRAGILVEHPPATAVMTEAAAEAARLRPYLTMYKAEQILNWRVDDGVVVMIVLEETACEPDDDYKDDEIKQWRVLKLENGRYLQQVWRKKKDGGKDEFIQHGDDIIPLMNNNALAYIPFVFAGIRDVSPSVDMPALMALVDTNLSHYRTSADYEHGLHWCGCPTLVISGYNNDPESPLTIGSGAAMILPDPNAKAMLLELKADSIGALKEALERKEGQMASLGARMLSPEKKAAEAADTAAIHRSGESSVLSSIAGSLSIALSKALTIMGEWTGSSEESTLKINRDYLPTGMSPQAITALLQSWQSGAISHESLYDSFVRGEVITSDSFEDEQEKIADNPAGMISADDQ